MRDEDKDNGKILGLSVVSCDHHVSLLFFVVGRVWQLL